MPEPARRPPTTRRVAAASSVAPARRRGRRGARARSAASRTCASCGSARGDRVLLIATNRGGLVAALLAGFGPGLFVALAIHHAGVERRRERAAGTRPQPRALARLERRWDALRAGWDRAAHEHPTPPTLTSSATPHRAARRAGAHVHGPPRAGVVAAVDQSGHARRRPRASGGGRGARPGARLPPGSDAGRAGNAARRRTMSSAPSSRGRGRQLAAGAAVDPILAAALGLVTIGGALLFYAEWTAGPWFLITATLGWLLRAWVQHRSKRPTPAPAASARSAAGRRWCAW